jgi:hypothetical protein
VHKKSRKGLVIGLVVVTVLVLLCAGIVSGGGSGSSSGSGGKTPGGSSSKSDTPAHLAGIGDPVRDGKFQFTVKKVTCGFRQIGTNQFLRKKAQGQFCLVTVTVKNIKNEPQTLLDSEQKAYVGSAQYSVDTEAGFAANEGGSGDSTNVWLQEINPGNSVTGVLVWDIPAGRKLSKLELHDSVFSNGVEVAVS